MGDYQFFYRLDTFQIDAVFIGCRTNSAKWKDPATYMEVNVTDPSFAVTRDHLVILDEDGRVVDTAPSPNPTQPAPSPNPHGELLAALHSYGVHSYTPAQVDAFIDRVDTVAELRALLKTMAKCILAFAEYFEA